MVTPEARPLIVSGTARGSYPPSRGQVYPNVNQGPVAACHRPLPCYRSTRRRSPVDVIVNVTVPVPVSDMVSGSSIPIAVST